MMIEAINWKQLATTDGYKSLKAAYVNSVQDAARQKRPLRNKAEFLKLFNWIINRAKHYAHHTGKPIEDILNEWESKRDYWWLGFYGDHRLSKFHSNSIKKMGINGCRKYYKSSWGYDPRSFRKRMQQVINKPSKKARWSMERKKRGY